MFVGKVVLPIEVYKAIQRYPKKLDETQTANMIKHILKMVALGPALFTNGL